MIPARHRLALVVLCLFVALGVLYSVTVPVFEASDEMNHYPYVANIARGDGLPVQIPGKHDLWEQEGSQPPLYYALAALLTAGIDSSDLQQVYAVNPHARKGIPLAQHNKNMMLHTGQEDFPWTGTVLAVHLIRLFSVLLGAGTVWCTYLLASELFPAFPALAVGAMAANAFNPMFLFITASVNNDNLVVFLASLTLLLLVRIVRGGVPRVGIAGLGLLIGLACLTKLSALGLVPLAGLALLFRRFQVKPDVAGDGSIALARPRSELFAAWVIDCIVLVITVAAVAGWWYVRNWYLYGEPTGTNVMLLIAGRRPSTPGLLDLLGEFEGFRINFWGLFGGVNVLMRPVWVYRLLDAVSVVAVIGLAFWLARAWRHRGPGAQAVRPDLVTRRDLLKPASWAGITLLVVWIAVVFVALVRWTTSTYASQGRLIFPTISALCLFLVLGLTAWLPARARRWAAFALPALLLVLAVSSPFLAVLPAYARPQIISAGDIPVSAIPFDVTYGDVARLRAYEIDPREVDSGGTLQVVLYWEALRRTSENYSIYLQLLGPANKMFVQLDSFPGGGAYPTSLWSPGEVIRDVYRVEVAPNQDGPMAPRVEVGLYLLETMQRLPARDAKGQAVLSPALARVKVKPVPAAALRASALRAPSHPLDANLANRVRLTGYDVPGERVDAGGEIPVTLYWNVTGTFEKEYRVLLQMLGPDDKIYGQGDGTPIGGEYPMTFWAPGDVLPDTHILKVHAGAAPGQYRLIAALYVRGSGQRLPVLDATGATTLDSVTLGTLEVGR